MDCVDELKTYMNSNFSKYWDLYLPLSGHDNGRKHKVRLSLPQRVRPILQEDTPYLACKDELWAVFGEYLLPSVCCIYTKTPMMISVITKKNNIPFVLYNCSNYRYRNNSIVLIGALDTLFYLTSEAHLVITFISIWISNHIPRKVWDLIIYPFPNFNSCTVVVW